MLDTPALGITGAGRDEVALRSDVLRDVSRLPLRGRRLCRRGRCGGLLGTRPDDVRWRVPRHLRRPAKRSTCPRCRCSVSGAPALTSETFFIDLATLAEQMGVPVDAMRAQLALLLQPASRSRSRRREARDARARTVHRVCTALRGHLRPFVRRSGTTASSRCVPTRTIVRAASRARRASRSQIHRRPGPATHACQAALHTASSSRSRGTRRSRSRRPSRASTARTGAGRSRPTSAIDHPTTGAVMLRSAVIAGDRHPQLHYGASSRDPKPRFGASAYLYGTALGDAGAGHRPHGPSCCASVRPMVSNGSLMTSRTPDVKTACARSASAADIVIVDPRRTAPSVRRPDEHVAIRPGTDAGLLLRAWRRSLVRDGSRVDHAADRVGGSRSMRGCARSISTQGARTGVPASRPCSACARFAAAPSNVASARRRRTGHSARSRPGDRSAERRGTPRRDRGIMFPPPGLRASLRMTGGDGHARRSHRARAGDHRRCRRPGSPTRSRRRATAARSVRCSRSRAARCCRSRTDAVSTVRSRASRTSWSRSTSTNETTPRVRDPAAGVGAHRGALRPRVPHAVHGAQRRAALAAGGGPGPGEKHDWEILLELARDARWRDRTWCARRRPRDEPLAERPRPDEVVAVRCCPSAAQRPVGRRLPQEGASR